MRYFFNSQTSFVALLFGALLMVQSCKKDEPEPIPLPTPIAQQPWDVAFTESSDPYFTATINGNLIQKTGNESSGFSFSIGSESHVSFGSGLSDDAANFIAGVDIGRLYLPSGGYPDSEALRMYARTGSYSFGIPELPNATTYHADVQYQDASGVNWSSYFGTGIQGPSASFSISDTLHINFLDGTKGVKFKANYSCTLYNLDGTASMPLTNGVYVGYLSEY